MRKAAWESPHCLLGGSDAGAHLDRMCGAPYTTDFIADCLRGKKLWPVEKAVQALSDAPARLFGLRDRGRVAAGMHADLVVFDPKTVGSSEIHERSDLPGGTSRLGGCAMIRGFGSVVSRAGGLVTRPTVLATVTV